MTVKLTITPNKEKPSDPRNGLNILASYLAENPELVVIVAICSVGSKNTKYADPDLNVDDEEEPKQFPFDLHYEQERKIGLNIIAVESVWGEDAQYAGELLERAYEERTGRERLPGAFRKALLNVHRCHPRRRPRPEPKDEDDNMITLSTKTLQELWPKRTD
jgi:hypothetical protein